MKTLKKPEEIRLVHRISNGKHRLEEHSLSSEPRTGEWASFKEIAILDNYRATTSYHDKVLPKVFRVVDVKCNEVND